MSPIRTLLRNHRAFAAMLLALALCLRALVPAGYMLAPSATLVSVEICGDSPGAHGGRAIVLPMRGTLSGDISGHGQTNGPQHQGGDQTCPYAGLAMASLGGVDAPLLAIALALAMLLGPGAIGPALFAPARRLRPPLRGPPARA